MAEREWLEKDFYAVLGVSETASDAEITKAFRSLAKKHHPDTHPGEEERFKDINAAYEVLGDATKRKEYDDMRRLGPLGGMGGGFNFTGDLGDLNDLFGGMFGQRQRRAQRGADIETGLHLGFRDAVLGVTTSVSLPSNEACHTCRGSGAAPGTGFAPCQRCHGQGVVNENQGPFAMSSMCPDCAGRGGRITTPCPSCHGSGREPSARRVNVKIPAGVVDGQRIRLKGKGQPGQRGGPAGDLFVDVHVATDPRFSRKGRHVTTTVHVSVADAVLGTTVSVPTLDDPVTVKIPAGTQPGATLRVKGRGVPASSKTALGDLLVTVQVRLPTELSDDERQLFEQLKTLEAS